MIKENKKAPTFTLPSTEGKDFELKIIKSPEKLKAIKPNLVGKLQSR